VRQRNVTCPGNQARPYSRVCGVCACVCRSPTPPRCLRRGTSAMARALHTGRVAKAVISMEGPLEQRLPKTRRAFLINLDYRSNLDNW
jgi:hypothetical protein